MLRFQLKYYYITLLLIIPLLGKAQYPSTQTGKVSFYSKAPLEDIEAHSKHLISVINPENRIVAFKLFINTFQFKNRLMQKHFNEKYMESEQYPDGSFKGTINEPVNLAMDGTYDVSVTGNLIIHGVAQERTLKGTITVKDGQMHLTSFFKVALKDHQIKIPELIFNKIAEVVEVTVEADYTVKKEETPVSN